MQTKIAFKIKNLLALIVLFILTQQLSKAQCTFTQLGIDIDGEANNDLSGGRSVSMSSDGSTVAIGATGNDAGGAQRGHVRVYKNISGTWAQQGADIDGITDYGLSGYSVSLSADGLTLAIGAPQNITQGTQSGYVRVYKFISGTWIQQGATINGEANGDGSGISVSLSSDGETLAIGASSNEGGGINRGHIRVYKNINGTWTQQGADIDGEEDGDAFGNSVSLSDDGLTVAIGASHNAGGGYRRGHVRVYKNISGTWTQQGADIDGESDGDHSGWSVSLSSDGLIVAIGPYVNDGGGNERGHVRIFKNINGTWTQQGADIDGESNLDHSGWSVSLSSDGLTVAFGAIWNSGGGFERGHVRVYKNISSTWTQQGADIDGEADEDHSGQSVSLSADGLTVAIGAPLNSGGGDARGHVRVYECKTTSSFTNFKTEKIDLVYPNPFIETLNLGSKLQEGERVNITIMDAMGKVVYSSLIDKSNTSLNLKSLSSGLYILCIFSNEHKESFKILKE